MKKKFDDKVALVTGAASGIGRVSAQIFAREGVKVIVSTDSNIKGGEETVRLIKDAGGEAIFVRCDISISSEVQAMVETCVRTYGSLDFAFNNAGIGPDGVRFPNVKTGDCPEEVWKRIMDVNLTGTWLCMKYEIKQMLTQGHGVIVNNSSIGGLKPAPGHGYYAVSKAAVIHLTKAAALEYATSGIRVNTILPGPIQRTGLMDNSLSSHAEEEESYKKVVPVEHFGNPEDIGEAVLWLCSDEANFITGLVMPIDGGMSAR
jgi:NAD(P)-dependent dehydrogenase (short-subunit alcohol dehydrogenase family)